MSEIDLFGMLEDAPLVAIAVWYLRRQIHAVRSEQAAIKGMLYAVFDKLGIPRPPVVRPDVDPVLGSFEHDAEGIDRAVAHAMELRRRRREPSAGVPEHRDHDPTPMKG